MKLKSEVFNKPEFQDFTKANLVLVEADFPRRKAQSEDVRKQNASLQALFRIQGYPTLIVANETGQHLSTLGYMLGRPERVSA